MLLQLDAASAYGVLDVLTFEQQDDIEQPGVATLACFAALTNEAPLSPWGLRIQRADGQVAFDSTRSPLFLTNAISMQFPAGTPLESMRVPRPWPEVQEPMCTAYACALTIRECFKAFEMETVEIDYTVGGGGNKAPRKELIVYSWPISAEPAGLF